VAHLVKENYDVYRSPAKFWDY